MQWARIHLSYKYDGQYFRSLLSYLKFYIVLDFLIKFSHILLLSTFSSLVYCSKHANHMCNEIIYIYLTNLTGNILEAYIHVYNFYCFGFFLSIFLTNYLWVIPPTWANATNMLYLCVISSYTSYSQILLGNILEAYINA